MQLWCQFFQNFVYGDVVYAKNFGGIGPEKLYRATLNKKTRRTCSSVSLWVASHAGKDELP